MAAWVESVSGKFLLGNVSPPTVFVITLVASVTCERSRKRSVEVESTVAPYVKKCSAPQNLRAAEAWTSPPMIC